MTLSAQHRSEDYANAFAMRARLAEFVTLLREPHQWHLVADILSVRFDRAFMAFLDAPTMRNLETVAGFTTDMANIAQRLAPPGRG